MACGSCSPQRACDSLSNHRRCSTKDNLRSQLVKRTLLVALKTGFAPMRMSLLPACFLLLAAFPQRQEKSLPEQTSFMEEFRKNLHAPDKLLSRYTYTENETEITLDSKGKIKKTETNVYNVFHGTEEWQTYERQISKNGVPLTRKELEKQDSKERERVENETRKRASWSEAKRKQEKAKAEREERESTDDIFATFEYQLVRREML